MADAVCKGAAPVHRSRLDRLPAEGGGVERHVFDRWRFLGSWRDGEPVLEAEPGFELDTYKMLAGCLRKLPKGARLEPWDGWPAA